MSIRKEGHIDPRADRLKIRAEVMREMERLGLEAENLMLKYLEKHHIDDRGGLAKSINSSVTDEMNRIRLQFGAGAKHAIFVHDGTRPHWIGKDTAAGKAITRWVVRKMGVKGDQAIKRTTFFVRRKIARYGTESKPFAQVAMRVLRREFPQRIQTAIENGARNAG